MDTGKLRQITGDKMATKSSDKNGDNVRRRETSDKNWPERDADEQMATKKLRQKQGNGR